MNVFSALIQTITAPFRFLLSWPARLIGAPRRLLGMSLPVRVATLVFLFLLVFDITILVAYWQSQNAVEFRTLPWAYFAGITLLSIAIPWVVYAALKLWLEGDASRFPDIDRAFKEGLAALSEQGMDILSAPLFLILGAANESVSDSLVAAAGLDLAVKATPRGRAPLRWYASERGILLVLPRVGQLAALQEQAAGSEASAPERGGGSAEANIKGTMVVGAGPVRGATPAVNEDEFDVQGTFSPSIQGTLVVDPRMTMTGGGAEPEHAGGQVSRKESARQTERLGYICELLRRARQPFVAINGVMTLISYQATQNVMYAKDMPDAVRDDLATIRTNTQVISPTVAMVHGMETESGFVELVHRVGISKARSARFGKGFDVWNAPTDENLDALSSHAVGAFEDWVYELFRDKQGLDGSDGNRRLYAMLTRIRRLLQPRLRSILVRGYGVESGLENTEPPQLFGGCYFSATGDDAEGRAFVRSVFEKMIDQEEELQWTDRAVRDDNRYRLLAQFMLAVDALLLVGMGFLLYREYWMGS